MAILIALLSREDAGACAPKASVVRDCKKDVRIGLPRRAQQLTAAEGERAPILTIGGAFPYASLRRCLQEKRWSADR